MNIQFSPEEQRAFLVRHGYELKQEKVKMFFPVYHNQVDTEEVEVWAVYKEGKPNAQPGSFNYGPNDWVARIFTHEIRKALLAL